MALAEMLQSLRVPISLTRFMELMRVDMARDLVRKINKFTQEMEVIRKPDAIKDARLVQTFLARMESDMIRHRIWASLSETDRLVLLEGVELYIMTKLYKRTFGRYKEDQERDARVTSRLFALQFVTPAHLDIPSDVLTNEAMVQAIRELQKINAFKSPRDKLTCILNGCEVILNLLQNKGEQTGADVFVPILNYVVIKTQPIHLISNIEFIRRFRMKSRLVSSADYYFTQLSATAYFIESADAGSFTDGRQEFLSSFLQHGLITWKQYEEALGQNGTGENMTRSLSISTTNASDDTNPGDAESGVTGSLYDLRSVMDEQQSSRTIHWEGLRGVSQLSKEGCATVVQMSRSDDLTSKHIFLNAHIVDMNVETVDKLLAEYKALVLSYEALCDAIDQVDTAAVLKVLAEYEIKAQWRSMLPSEGRLLIKYPFLCSSFQDLTFHDVHQLLHSYKTLALQCESLVAGMKQRVRYNSYNEFQQDELEVLTPDSMRRDPLGQQPPLITRFSDEKAKLRNRMSSGDPLQEDLIKFSNELKEQDQVQMSKEEEIFIQEKGRRLSHSKENTNHHSNSAISLSLGIVDDNIELKLSPCE